jgi:hypothetical protein
LRFHGAHQAQLQPATAVRLQNTNPAEISSSTRARRSNKPGETDRLTSAIDEPPMAPIEIWDRGTVEERPTVEISQCISDLILLSIYRSDLVH